MVGDELRLVGMSADEVDPKFRPGLVHRQLFAEALNEYAGVRARDAAGEAWEWLERLAEHWRRGAQLTGLEFLGDGFLPDDAMALLGALESSLTLIATHDPGRAELTLTADETLAGMILVGGRLWAGWDRVLNDMWRHREHVAGRPDTDRPDDWPPMPEPAKRPRRSKAATRELGEGLGETFVAATQLYPRLDPDGRPLTGAERRAVVKEIRDVAAVDLRIYRASGLFSADDWDGIAIQLAELLSIARSLVLALSDDAARRRLAMSLEHLREHVFMSTHRITTGASWQEAAEALRAFVAEQQA